MKYAVFLTFFQFAACQSAGQHSASTSSVVLQNHFGPVVTKTPISATYCPDAQDGAPCLMTWSDAISFCRTQGGHLPTTREYISIAQPLGTTILETKNVIGTPPAGFYLVDGINLDGERDAFYANHTAYKRPDDQLTNHLLWTTTRPAEHLQYAHVYYDEWGGGGGKPEDHKIDRHNAVQCVENE